MARAGSARITAADRLREVALGREGVQLLDWLGKRPRMPTAGPLGRTLPVHPALGGATVSLAGLAVPNRTGIAVRVLDAAGRALRTASPFQDRQGAFLWCGVPCMPEIFLPLLGVEDCAEARLEVHAFRLGRGPATPLGFAVGNVGPVGGDPWSLQAWAEPLVVLAVAIAHADGIVHTAERIALERLFEQFGLDGLDLDAALARPTPAELHDHVQRMRMRMTAVGPRTLMERLGAIAVSNGSPGQPERDVLHEIAEALGVPAAAFQRLLDGWHLPGRRAPTDLAAAYQVLGVQPGDSRRTIKKRWRDLVRENHPDLQANADAEARQRATERTAELNGAFRIIGDRAAVGVPAPPREQASGLEEVAPEAVKRYKQRKQRKQHKWRRWHKRHKWHEWQHRWASLWRLSSLQIAGGLVALALLAFAAGLALNGHVEVALAAVEGVLR